jgi:hypothetical protein
MDLIFNNRTNSTYGDTTNSISKAPITREDLSEELQEQLEELKKMHDYSYAKKCALEKLEKEYQKIINTDIWYDAAKAYLNGKINTSKLDSLIFDFKHKQSLYDWSNSGEGVEYNSDYASNYTDRSLVYSVNNIFSIIDNRIKIEDHYVRFRVDDNDGEERWITINDSHQTTPKVELKDKFKMFCIKYKNI